MIALVQRVKKARVRVDDENVSSIGQGLLILLGIHRDDGPGEVDWVARKCANLRIFSDDDGKMNLSVVDVNGETLVVSQFTLYGSVEKGNRPSFVDSAPPEIAEPLYVEFVRRIADLTGRPTRTGRFGAMMDVELTNDGPVTIAIRRES